MDPRKLLEDLKEAHEHLEIFKSQEKDIIKEEVELLTSWFNEISKFGTKRSIHNKEAVLIYVFASKEKTLISPEVYLKANGEIAYQVYNEVGYRGFRPHANINDGYVSIPAEEFLQFVSFFDIFEFFIERVDVLYEDAERTHSKNEERKEFLSKFKNLL